MIGLEATREAYGSHDIADIGWVRSGDNPTDCLTKAGVCDPMTRLMDKGKLDLEVLQWVVRNDGRKEKHSP